MQLGPTPEVTIAKVGGDVEVRGGEYVETTVDADGPDKGATQSDSACSAESCGGDCVIRLPAAGKAHFEQVGGQMRVKGIFGGVEAGRIGGDFAARRCGLFQIGKIGGDADLREVDGEISLGAVGGNAIVRECTGMLTVEKVGGNCDAQDVPAGLYLGAVGGNLKVCTRIEPGASYTAHAKGDLEFRIPPDSSLRIVLPAKSNLRVDSGMEPIHEGDKLIITLGSGEATAELSARGTLRVRFDSDYRREREFRSGMDQDFDAYMMDVSAQIDTHLRGLERHMEDLPEHIRHRVEGKINAAIRNVESAERHARRVGHSPAVNWSGQGGSSSEPVSEEERLAILKMLEEGKITVQDAQQLLAALEGES
jgi:hypothetical protein